MRRITIIGCLIGLLSLTVSAQSTRTSSSHSDTRTTNVEVQKKPTASFEELLVRYQNLGSTSGFLSEYFSKEEQQILNSHFKNQKPVQSDQVVMGVRTNNTAEPNPIFVSNNKAFTPLFVALPSRPDAREGKLSDVSPENRAAFQQTPLFLAPSALTAEEEAEILAAEQQRENTNVIANYEPQGNVILSAIVPTAGATETFAVVTGDFFYDPTDGVNGGPGGDCTTTSSGNPGDYPNCGCVTTTTLTGTDLSVEFLSFKVFGTFDFLNIYDGPDTSSPQIYDSNLNSDTDTLAGMIAANGSGVFTSTSGALTFEFNATAVVNSCGWEVEILNAGGGGGSGCSTGVYTSRATFDAETGPLNLEDFAGGPGSLVQCGLVISNTGDSCFPAGEILPGIEITSNNSAGDQTVYVDPADGFGNTVPIVGSNAFVDYTIINFPNNDVNSFGFDLITLLGTGPVEVRIFGAGGLIDTQIATGTNPESFWGYIASETIVSVELEDLSGANIEGIGMVAFGNCSGGGGGTACSQDNPENAFENGYTTSSNQSQRIAFDITVPADTDFTLDTATVNIWMNPGATLTSSDITFYSDAGGIPGAVIATQSAVVPTSQTVIGNNFGFDISEVVFDIAPEMLAGQAGVETTYWVVFTVNISSGSGYISSTTASIEGFEAYFSTDGGATWILIAGNDIVYNFEGECETIGGGGGMLDTAYGINNGNLELIGFPVTDPSSVEVYGDSPITVNFENAGAIDPANPTTGYVLDNTGAFFSFDVASGFYTALGTINGEWLGMEYDQSTGILYAITLTELYTIDPIGVSATLVGPLGLAGGALPIALAIDGAGVGYTYDLVDDNLYSINMATGATTLIGNIGFDANFGQGMCYDSVTDTVYMAAFNGGTFAAEWRSVNTTTGATSLIGPIITTAATTQVAWVSIGESLPPPACPEPTNLVVSNITPTTADLSWSAEPNASNGYIWYVFDQGANPLTDPPVATGTVPAGTTNVTATGLEGGLSYDFYIVADCDSDGLSQLAGPISFATPPACGGKFYDTGGPGGDYQNNENVTTTITPINSGEVVTVTFTAFEVEATWDALYVYDGPDTSSPLISSGNPPTNSGFPAGGYYGTSIPGPFVSTHPSGALTFVFMSDSSVPQSGWEADVTCALTPPPNDMIVNSIDVDEIGFPYTDPAVHMPAATPENGNPINCDLTGANGVWYNFVPEGDGTANATIVSPSGASSVTFYTAPNENAVETDLTLVPQQTNQCAPGTSASIFTLGGQAYYVFVLNTGSITDIVIDGTNLGISDNTIAGFSYYPNPTNNILNLQSIESIEQVSFYNVLGQLVIENTVNATSTQVDISNLNTGTYIMKVTVNGEIGTYRVLKQ
ncbi:T9SS type A sorting domain-containing protein [Aequorivita sp. SDUM287046]|uniref:T9SS type A sorting domain-containing protein n=1 Tax=Aequorivita aurantiaca TaxID=3053356 RepID=A0ABT8DJE9_9FLAO|nr:T9SS type A sorting domain-containing protein [Aequorivita aurantiaca]MDN3725448.1 T9SS type A sorting domain-containing protein [Aequorivita aurantiaca]